MTGRIARALVSPRTKGCARSRHAIPGVVTVVPSAGLEPALPAPEAGALSAELRGLGGPSLATRLFAQAGERGARGCVDYASNADDRGTSDRARHRGSGRGRARARAGGRPAGGGALQAPTEGAWRLRDQRGARPRAAGRSFAP